jgi:ribosomal protein S24E
MIKIEKKENKLLLEREEIQAISQDKVTPSMASVKEELANLLKKDKELIVVKKVESKFGVQEARITAYVYDSPESLKKFEPKKKEKKTADKKE